jgi:RNA polymerase sigma-70 factor (ECF subfamily)
MELPVNDLGEDDELAELAARAREGSASAFNQLAARVRERVRAWARRLTGDDDEAEDVAQLVLLRLHQRVAQFEGRSRFTTWLYSVTRGVALTRFAKERRRSELLADRNAEIANEAEPENVNNAEQTAHVLRLVTAHFEELSGREREVFELADLRGLTSREIGAKLGIKPVTARVVLIKARRRIRLRMLAAHPELLEEYGS